MDEKVGAQKVEMAIPDEILATSTPFDNSERRSTFVVSKDDKENAGLRKGPRKKWNVNPDLSVILPPWSECDGKDTSCKDIVASTSTKASSTFIICKGDVDSVAEQGIKLKANIQCDRTSGNHGPVNISNNINSTKQTDKKHVRRSLQVVSTAKVENKRRVQQRRSTDVRRVATNRPAGLPQQRLTLKKSTTTSIKHKEPLPYACRSTLYDEHWVSKQERAFTKWLNYMLAPVDCYGNSIPTNQKNYEASTKYVDNIGQLQFRDEALVNHTKISPLESCRKEARLRQSACLLYQSFPLEEVFLKLELEVETGRLSMRLDRTIYSDIGLRQQLIELLNSYNAPWLKLGVEVLFGEALPMCAAGGELVDFGTYCVKRLCENDNISRTYMYKTGTHGPGYQEALLKFAYRKLLMMVIFLDKAKMERLMDNNPCLFVKTANVKSSKQVLFTLSDIFLCGEGDVVKHLRLLGYTLHHIQRPLDEYDFAVTNLATDLRDGVRLCRLTEILTNNWELSGQLRVPAAGKTQELRNVDAVLKALRQYVNFPQLVTAPVIVQGHRELTLSLLWSIIFHFKVELELDQEELKKEIEHLKGQRQHPIALTNFCQRRDLLEASIFFKSPSISLLLQWCQAVCTLYGVTVTNFTSSFCDGRVFCYIIHHYHPSLLPVEAINNHTSLNIAPPPVEEQEQEPTLHNWTRNFSPTTNKETEIIANEKANFKLLSEKMLLLGGVPPIVMSKDMVNTVPDEKVVIMYTSYLCKQLLSISSEVRASIVIQRAWRRLHVKVELKKKLMKRNGAAVLIQAHVRRYLAQVSYNRVRRAAIVIQQHWKAHYEMLQQRRYYLLMQQAVLVIQQQFRLHRTTKRCKAAQIIQAYVRGHLQFLQYKRLKHAACVIQLAYRRYLAVLAAEEARRQSAVVKLQSYWRKCIHQQNYIKLKSACILIQRCYRCYRARSAFEVKRTAAIVIQSSFRGYRTRQKYLAQKRATIVIQQWYRSVSMGREVEAEYKRTVRYIRLIQHYVKKWFHRRVEAVVKLQATIRSCLQRRRYVKMQKAALIIQQHYRAHQLAGQCRQHYCELKNSCILLQAVIRGWRERQAYKQTQSAVVRIQSWYRCQVARQRYITMRNACNVITYHWRAVKMGREQRLVYHDLYCKVVRLQAVVRGWLCRKWVGLCRTSTVVIQKAYRAHLSRRHTAATKVQATFRAHRARQLFLTVRQAACVIQVHYRAVREGRRLQEEYHLMRTSVITIQTAYRRHLAYRNYVQLKMAALTIQTNWRRHKQQSEYNVTRAAILYIQRWYRWARMGKLLHQRYLQLQWAAITIQHSFVAYKKRKQQRAAVKIQSVMRCVLARKKYLQKVGAAVMIQAFTRGYLVRSHVRSLTAAVRKIEMYYKAKLVGRKTLAEYQCIRTACITIQAAFKGWKVCDYFVRLHVAVQTVERAWLTRQQRACYLRLKQSTVIIQQWFRSILCTRQAHMEYIQMKSAAVVLQSFARGLVARRLYRSHLAARKIQTCYRGYRVRCHFLRIQSACVTIQSCIRRYTARKRYLALKGASLIIQSRIRALYCGRATRNKYLQLTNATILIQATYRAVRQRNVFLQLRQAALTIQAAVRMYQCRKVYLNKMAAVLVLQRHTRALLQARRVRCSYVAMREAAIVIQSAYRKHRITRRHHAAVTIQSHYRRYIAQVRYNTLRAATVNVQRFWRGWQCYDHYQKLRHAALVIQTRIRALYCSRAIRNKYLQLTKATILIQATQRAKMQRNFFLELKKKAIVIQSWYRMNVVRKHYLDMRRAAVTLQAYVRSHLLTKMISNDYRTLRKAAITIQSHYRAHRQRSEYLQLRQAALTIQAVVRMYQCRKLYLNKMAAVLVLQRHTRSLLQARRVRCSYVAMRQAAIVIQSAYRKHRITRRHHAAVTIQSHYRRYIAQVRYNTLRAAAVNVQRFWRGWQCYDHYQKLRHAALVIQSRIRALYCSRAIRNKYLQLTKATVLIQATHRAKMQRNIYLELKKKVIVIQSWYRMGVVRKHYLNMRRAAVTLQAYVRSHLLTKMISNDYRALKKAAITIQSHYRVHQQRSKYLQLRQAALTIQAVVRMYQCRKLYLNKMAAVLVLQRHTRSLLQARRVRCFYVAMRQAAIVIQSAYRKHRITRRHHAAVTIQSHYRRYIAQVRYNALRAATVNVQRFWRGWQCYDYYQKLRQATLVIQSRIRALYFSRAIRNKYLQLINATVLIQATYRAKMQRNIFLELKEKAIVIQSWYRMNLVRKHYLNMRRAAVTLQAYVRSHLLTKMISNDYRALREAAITIQSHYRAHRQRSEYLQLRQAALTIQAVVRMYQCRKLYLSKIAAVLVLQRHTRSLLQGKHIRCSYVAMRDATIVIQSAYRKHQTTRRHQAAVTIQSHYRRYTTQVRYNALRAAAVNVQRFWRGWQCWVHYNKMRKAALCLQRSYRGYTVRVKMQQEVERRVRAAILIQATYRGHLCHTRFTKVRRTVITLQSRFRQLKVQKEFNHIRTNVIFIQQKWRATLLARNVHAEFNAKRQAAMVIQHHFRAYQYMKETQYQFHCFRSAALTLQRAFRHYLTYRRHQREVAATCIQRAYRQYKMIVEMKKRAEYLKQFSRLAVMNLSAILIQHSWRHYQCRLLEQRRQLAAVKLQAWFKMIMVRQRYRKLLSSVNAVQQLCRNQIRCIHQRRLHCCATVIQAHWRGYWVRCQVGSHVEEMRQRIKRASSEERQRVTLRDQMPGLLQLLMKGKYLSHGSYVLEKLELITRLSDGCSLVLVQAGALPALYDVIDGTNRNRASLLLVETALQILLNLTRWSSTLPAILQHHGFVSMIVRLMQKVYISQADIFQQCCHLLSVYCKQQEVELAQTHLAPEIKRLHNMATSLKDKLAVLRRKWQRRTMTPLIQQQHQQLQTSLCTLEKMLNTPVISNY